jgi:hypothetical protein
MRISNQQHFLVLYKQVAEHRTSETQAMEFLDFRQVTIEFLNTI